MRRMMTSTNANKQSLIKKLSLDIDLVNKSSLPIDSEAIQEQVDEPDSAAMPLTFRPMKAEAST